MKRSLNLIVICAVLATGHAAHAAISPWNFNVVSLGDVGTAGTPYTSDFQGTAAIGGNAYLNGFSLHDVAGAGGNTPYSLYIGGNLNLGGSIHNGGVEAGGSIHMTGATIGGNVSAGGNLTGTGGSISGNVALQGTKNVGSVVTVAGSLTENQPFTPTLDLPGMSNYFKNFSSTYGAMASNATVNNAWGELQVELVDGINIVNVSGADFAAAWGFKVTGSSNAKIIVNILDTSVSFDSITWATSGGVGLSDILVNLPNATTLDFSGGQHLSTLAPFAATHFSSGVLAGNLIVGSLWGGGQVNVGVFNAPGDIDVTISTIPEPASVLLATAGALAILPRRKARR